MAKIKFSIRFNTTIEVSQKDLKIQLENGEIINPSNISPYTIRESIENGDYKLILSDHISDFQIENLKVDFEESSL